MKRAANIALGSNSTRMLTANLDSDLSEPIRAREETRLFLSLEKGQELKPAVVLRVREAVEMLYDKAIAAGAERVFITATSAVRDARDTGPLCEGILLDTGEKLQVLSGKQEAACSFLGAVRTCLKDRPLGVVDIGGGSTEIATGSMEVPRRVLSLQLGASRLYAISPIDDFSGLVPALAQAERMLNADVWDSDPPPQKWFLVGGTGTALIRLLKELPMNHGEIEDQEFTLPEASAMLRKLARLMPMERSALPGMTLGRENILPTGLAVLTSLMTRLDIARMTVTARNNTDGFLYTLYKNQHE